MLFSGIVIYNHAVWFKCFKGSCTAGYTQKQRYVASVFGESFLFQHFFRPPSLFK